MTPTGPLRLQAGDLVAEIDPVGAMLVRLAHRGRDLVVPVDRERGLPPYGGALLAPWPNRVIDGSYRFGGAAPLRLGITEPARGHALHGLVTATRFAVAAHEPDAHEPDAHASDHGHPAGACGAATLELHGEIPSPPGYPWRVELACVFRLTPAGLEQTVRATNRSATPAPYGVGAHPYLRGGDGPLDSWELELPAALVQLTAGERLLPGATVPVERDAERFDFRAPRAVGAARIDHAFTGLAADADGLVRVRLRAADGGGVELRWDARCPWAQVCTADADAEGPGSAAHRAGLAVEPMSCPPDAFNSGVDLLTLAPGERTEHAWTLAPLAAR